ncbi:hypothetical protein [Clostridium sp. OS1-26]|uniref:hypothetical protein n=1 Tax=Clostridium sp. OS1-26 TaxID=3070681 RepID=UPI0027DFE5CE|nr:hypothetical protein [Clostridium sp. OS1-26]WML35909.1 hypothetical protein RCG18_03955 [Clostridium sp. OS1-26]
MKREKIFRQGKPNECSYTLETKPGQKRVYETITGLFTDEEYSEYHNEYAVQLCSEIKNMGKWIKVVDMRKYKMSSVVESVSKHLKWCSDNGLQASIVIADGVLVKSQMNRSTKVDGSKELFPQFYVTTLEEAEAKARELGY